MARRGTSVRLVTITRALMGFVGVSLLLTVSLHALGHGSPATTATAGGEGAKAAMASTNAARYVILKTNCPHVMFRPSGVFLGNHTRIAIAGMVLDVTTFVPKHPGGTVIRTYEAKENEDVKDSAPLFESHHPPSVFDMLSHFCIGTLTT